MISCPIPQHRPDTIELGHGSGGELTARLIADVFAPAFRNPILDRAHDGAITELPEGRLAISTDSFVVSPLFFPGGDIGDLAVNGTVNDLLCCGARPRWLSASFIIEEGTPMDDLRRIVASMAKAAREAEVEIVTGDTKVVERGHGDGVYITTTGVGIMPPDITLDPANLRPGDAVLLTGAIGNHGVAIMSKREGLQFDTDIESDTASLGDITAALLDAAPGDKLRVLRDPTRGGLATTLNELARASKVNITIDERTVPIEPAVENACALLGLDPYHVANEGIMIAVVDATRAEKALSAIRRSAHGSKGAIIGYVESRESDDEGSSVWLRMTTGTTRRLEPLAGEQLPRIC